MNENWFSFSDCYTQNMVIRAFSISDVPVNLMRCENNSEKKIDFAMKFTREWFPNFSIFSFLN